VRFVPFFSAGGHRSFSRARSVRVVILGPTILFRQLHPPLIHSVVCVCVCVDPKDRIYVYAHEYHRYSCCCRVPTTLLTQIYIFCSAFFSSFRRVHSSFIILSCPSIVSVGVDSPARRILVESSVAALGRELLSAMWRLPSLGMGARFDAPATGR